jgi:hypothetical protein
MERRQALWQFFWTRATPPQCGSTILEEDATAYAGNIGTERSDTMLTTRLAPPKMLISKQTLPDHGISGHGRPHWH